MLQALIRAVRTEPERSKRINAQNVPQSPLPLYLSQLFRSELRDPLQSTLRLYGQGTCLSTQVGDVPVAKHDHLTIRCRTKKVQNNSTEALWIMDWTLKLIRCVFVTININIVVILNGTSYFCYGRNTYYTIAAVFFLFSWANDTIGRTVHCI